MLHTLFNQLPPKATSQKNSPAVRLASYNRGRDRTIPSAKIQKTPFEEQALTR